MIYNLNNPLDDESFKLACNKLYAKRSSSGQRSIVEMTEKGTRTLSQNAYLHVILRYFAAMYGCSEEDAKQDFFKEMVNPDVFLIGYRVDRLSGKTKPVLRHSAMVDKDVLKRCIDRFLVWSAQVAEIYLPRADEKEKVAYCEAEAKKREAWL